MQESDIDKHDRWKLGEPFWRSPRVWGESLFFIREDPAGSAFARLLFPPSNALKLTSASRELLYTEGLDYVVDADARTVTLTRNSSVPFMDRAALYPPVGRERSISHKRGDERTGLYFSEGHHFHDLQAEASYRHHAEWRHAVPTFQGALIPRTVNRLAQRSTLKICLCGDSITAGANASACTGVRPGMPPYPELFAEALRRRYGGEVVINNIALAGRGVEHWLEVAGAIMEAKPDVVLVAYGMNDVGWKTVDEYMGYVTRLIDTVNAKTPETEIILVASMLGNPEWHNTPFDKFFAYRAGLKSLCRTGVALADVTQLWADMLQYKSYHDLTGNGVNHPNDFGHRTYAQVLLDLVVDAGS